MASARGITSFTTTWDMSRKGEDAGKEERRCDDAGSNKKLRTIIIQAPTTLMCTSTTWQCMRDLVTQTKMLGPCAARKNTQQYPQIKAVSLTTTRGPLRCAHQFQRTTITEGGHCAARKLLKTTGITQRGRSDAELPQIPTPAWVHSRSKRAQSAWTMVSFP